MSDSALSSSGTGGLGTVMLAVPSKKVRLFVLLFLPDLFALSLSLCARGFLEPKGTPTNECSVLTLLPARFSNLSFSLYLSRGRTG